MFLVRATTFFRISHLFVPSRIGKRKNPIYDFWTLSAAVTVPRQRGCADPLSSSGRDVKRCGGEGVIAAKTDERLSDSFGRLIICA